MAHRFLDLAFTPRVLDAQRHYYGQPQSLPPSRADDPLGAPEAEFIAACDSFYLGSVSETGWPYVQHRGGPRGFLRVLNPNELAFADYRGNRQLLTSGNVAANDRVCLFLMDYPRRERLKILGHATVVDARDHPALAAQIATAHPSPPAERIVRIRVVGFDWNCPKYITPRFTKAQVESAIAPLQARIAELEARLKKSAL